MPYNPVTGENELDEVLAPAEPIVTQRASTGPTQDAATAQTVRNQTAREEAFRTAPITTETEGVTVDKRAAKVKGTMTRKDASGKVIDEVILLEDVSNAPEAFTDTRLKELSTQTRTFLSATRQRQAEVSELTSAAGTPRPVTGYAEIVSAALGGNIAAPIVMETFFTELNKEKLRANAVNDGPRLGELDRMQRHVVDKLGGWDYQQRIGKQLETMPDGVRKESIKRASLADYDQKMHQSGGRDGASNRRNEAYWLSRFPDASPADLKAVMALENNDIGFREATPSQQAMFQSNTKEEYAERMKQVTVDGLVNTYTSSLKQGDPATVELQDSISNVLRDLDGPMREVARVVIGQMTKPISDATDETGKRNAAFRAARNVSVDAGRVIAQIDEATETHLGVWDSMFLETASPDKIRWYNDNRPRIRQEILKAAQLAAAKRGTYDIKLVDAGDRLQVDQDLDGAMSKPLDTVFNELSTQIDRELTAEEKARVPVGSDGMRVAMTELYNIDPADVNDTRTNNKIRQVKLMTDRWAETLGDADTVSAIKDHTRAVYGDTAEIVDPTTRKVRRDSREKLRGAMVREHARLARAGVTNFATATPSEEYQREVEMIRSSYDESLNYGTPELVFNARNMSAEAVQQYMEVGSARASGDHIKAAELSERPLSAFTARAEDARTAMSGLSGLVDVALMDGSGRATKDLKKYIIPTKSDTSLIDAVEQYRWDTSSGVANAGAVIRKGLFRDSKSDIVNRRFKDVPAATATGIYLMGLAGAQDLPLEFIGTDPAAFAAKVFEKREQWAGRKFRGPEAFLKAMADDEKRTGTVTVTAPAAPGSQGNPILVRTPEEAKAAKKNNPDGYYTDGTHVKQGKDL